MTDPLVVALRDPASVFVPVVRERARFLAPLIWCCALLLVAMSGPLGIMPPLGAWVVEWIMVGCLAVVSVGHVLRLWSDRYLQLASHMQLWLPLLIPTIGLYATKQEVYASLFIVMIASAGALLHRKLTLATIATVGALATVLLVRADGEFTGVYISAIWFAGLSAVTIHMTMSRAFLRAAEMRDVADQNAREASERFAELQRAQEERARLQEQLLHSQRMEAVGTLAAGIAHDMNNVLVSISSLASLLRDSDRRAHEDLDLIITQTERGASLTRGLLAFSRRGQYRKRPIALWEVVRQLIPILERTLPKTMTIRAELPEERVCVEADPTHLEQMLVNLALNARDAMGSAGTLSIVGDLARDGRARLRVTDTGKGMDDATRIRVFEPFFTTKPLGKGTGLGLSTVWGIVQAHAGEIAVESAPGAGATFTIVLPTSDAEPTLRIPLTPLAAAELPVTAVRGTVLVVDDEAAVRNTSMRLLERMGLDVISAENGLEALAKLHDGVQLVVLDMGMPVMGGAECFRRLRERSDVPVLIATGYASDEDAQAIVARGASLLEKPFTTAQLKQEVSRLLARTQTGSPLDRRREPCGVGIHS